MLLTLLKTFFVVRCVFLYMDLACASEPASREMFSSDLVSSGDGLLRECQHHRHGLQLEGRSRLLRPHPPLQAAAHPVLQPERGGRAGEQRPRLQGG